MVKHTFWNQTLSSNEIFNLQERINKIETLMSKFEALQTFIELLVKEN